MRKNRARSKKESRSKKRRSQNKSSRFKNNIVVALAAVFVLASIIIISNLNSKNELNTSVTNPVFKKTGPKEKTRKFVYPLGNVVGIKANTDGVLVLGYEDESVQYIGGIQIGDNIIKIDDKKITDSEDVSDILNSEKKKEVKITFEREGAHKNEVVRTKQVRGKYMLGLWVRDKVSGIGTLTYLDPATGNLGAIGHAIKDNDTNELLKISEGYMYMPGKIKINKSTDGKVGFIEGDYAESELIGKFKDNSDIGIRGILSDEAKNEEIADSQSSQLMEVADSDEVKIGKAQILFEDKNKNITPYDVKIEEMTSSNGSSKEMVLRVVDKKLIDYTGGIVQGMSGAPIIQNNKIIGAVTHVSRNNPQKGYGIFIHEMIEL
ncbi:MAG: peptidase S55 [Clostridioides sp.]|jgi:stage IV sporulation protein B|nr:peptidase S55 [Clostridioides sp.]